MRRPRHETLGQRELQRTVREKSGLRWRAGDLEVWDGFAEYLLGLMGTLLACWCFTLLSPASTFTALCRAIVGVWLSAGSVRVCTVGGRDVVFVQFAVLGSFFQNTSS